MMKKVYAGIGLVAVFSLLAYLYYSNQQPAAPGMGVSSGIQSQIDASDKSGPSTRIQYEGVIQDSSALSQQTRTEQQEEDLLRERSAKAVAVRLEIDQLILDLDDNLSDPSKRKELKQQINNKMAEYNQYILPVAVNAMQNQR